MSLMENLAKLNPVDGQLRGLRSRLESAERYHGAQAKTVAEIAGRLEELEVRKRHTQAKIGNLETEGGVLDEQLEKFRRDLNTAATNKQYAAVLSELNTVKEARTKIDDSILEEMSEIERLDEQIAEVTVERDERAKILQVAVTQLQERKEEIGDRLTELDAERDEAASALPSDVLDIFEHMADVHEGEAMAAVQEIDRRRREYSCGACNMHLPFDQIATLMSPSGGLVRCTACGRILYMQDEIRGALAPK